MASFRARAKSGWFRTLVEIPATPEITLAGVRSCIWQGFLEPVGAYVLRRQLPEIQPGSDGKVCGTMLLRPRSPWSPDFIAKHRSEVGPRPLSMALRRVFRRPGGEFGKRLLVPVEFDSGPFMASTISRAVSNSSALTRLLPDMLMVMVTHHHTVRLPVPGISVCNPEPPAFRLPGTAILTVAFSGSLKVGGGRCRKISPQKSGCRKIMPAEQREFRGPAAERGKIPTRHGTPGEDCLPIDNACCFEPGF